MPTQIDHSILNAALVGFEAQRQEIEERIVAIRRQLVGHSPGSTTADGKQPKRRLSAKGIAAIRRAAKKRWAAVHAEEKAAQKVTRKRLSPAAKAKLAANLRKARAAKAAKRAAAA